MFLISKHGHAVYFYAFYAMPGIPALTSIQPPPTIYSCKTPMEAFQFHPVYRLGTYIWHIS